MGPDTEYDVIVVGAGPSGLMVALRAAQRGARVLMLDKRSRIGLPVQCAECIDPAAFHAVGLDPDPSWVANRVYGMHAHFPAHKEVVITTRREGVVLNRARFEEGLAGLVEAAGATIRLGTTVIGLRGGYCGEVNTTRGVYSTRVIIGADGIGSRVGRWAGLPTRLRTADCGVCGRPVRCR